MKKQRILMIAGLILVIAVCLVFLLPQGQQDIVVYYTNDVHSYIDNHLDEEPGLSYSKVAALDYVAEDYMVLANYIQSFPVDESTGLPTITAESGYENVTGSGRITVIVD